MIGGNMGAGWAHGNWGWHLRSRWQTAFRRAVEPVPRPWMAMRCRAYGCSIAAHNEQEVSRGILFCLNDIDTVIGVRAASIPLLQPRGSLRSNRR
jgi:hypothetical protein